MLARRHMDNGQYRYWKPSFHTIAVILPPTNGSMINIDTTAQRTDVRGLITVASLTSQTRDQTRHLINTRALVER